MSKINLDHPRNKNIRLRYTFAGILRVCTMGTILLVLVCGRFPLVASCDEEVDSCNGIKEEYILSESNQIVTSERDLIQEPQMRSNCVKYAGAMQIINDKNENEVGISTIIKIFTFLLTVLIGSFTTFSIIMGYTVWKTQSSYEKEVARAKEAADKAENVLKDIEARGEIAIQEFEKRTKEIIKGEKSDFETSTKFVSITTMVGDYLSRAKELFEELLSTKDVNRAVKIIPEERDFLTLTLVHLKKLPEKLTIEECIRYKGTFDKLLKDARDIKACLKRVRYEGMVRDLADTCDEIIEILEALIAKTENST